MKSHRIDLRVSEQDKATLELAARLRNTSLSGFVLETARLAAEMLIADTHEFRLSVERMEAFYSALDAPPGVIPELRALLREPTVLEQ